MDSRSRHVGDADDDAQQTLWATVVPILLLASLWLLSKYLAFRKLDTQRRKHESQNVIPIPNDSMLQPSPGGWNSSMMSSSSSGSSSAFASQSSGGRFTRIVDRFKSLEEVHEALRKNGLESCNLILGIDYTSSNTWTGRNSFSGKSLHTLDSRIENPYQSVIRIVGRTLGGFDEDHLIPVYGFGDVSTRDTAVFPFFPDRDSNGFEEVLQRYNEITTTIRLSGPTSFVPLIRQAIRIVQIRKAYHVLIIIADGQIDDRDETARLIVEASHYPLSIIMIGVGDGPFHDMVLFDDALPEREFDNFQFVQYSGEHFPNTPSGDVEFAVNALMEIPDQYLAIRELNILGRNRRNGLSEPLDSNSNIKFE